MSKMELYSKWYSFIVLWLFFCIGDAAWATKPMSPIIQPPVKGLGVLQVLASVGPSHYLSAAEVTLKDASGKTISKGVTNTRGSVFFYLRGNKLRFASRPLSVSTKGGKIISHGGDYFSGPFFNGHLRASIDKAPLNAHTILYVDMVSTSASRLKGKTISYKSAIRAVRNALGFNPRFPDAGMRVGNQFVGWEELKSNYEAAGGYDEYINNLVGLIKKRKLIGGLRPTRSSILRVSSGKESNNPLLNALRSSDHHDSSNGFVVKSSQTSSYPQCNVPVGNTNGNSSESTELIEDFGATSISYLLKYAGVPSSAASGVAGMLLTGGATGNQTTAQLEAVEEQLYCISEQLTYLTTQVEEVQFYQDVEVAVECGNDVADAYYSYSSLVAGSLPYDTSTTGVQAPTCYASQTDGAASTCPLNASNAALMNDLPTWNPSGTLMATTCSGPVGVDAMLFGNSSAGQPCAWCQLNANFQDDTVAGYSWYTYTQVQQLQQFLSYWGTIEYDMFLLTNEYSNYTQDFEAAEINAGNVPGCSTQCAIGSDPSTSAPSPNYCVAQFDLQNAFPASLYSDEIGMWNGTGAGLAINAFPAGLVMHNPLDNPTQPIGQQTALSPLYIYNTSGKSSTWSANATSGSNSSNSYYGATPPSYSAFNGYAGNGATLNPGNLPSAVEQFSNPQALRTLQPVSSQLQSITNNNYQQGPGNPGFTSWEFFVNAINQTCETWQTINDVRTCVQYFVFPIASQWTGLTPTNSTSNGTGFFAADDISNLTWYYQDGTDCNSGANECITTSDTYNNTIGQYHWQYTNPDGNNANANPGGYYPVFGALLGRTWWNAYTTNPPANYVRQPVPTSSTCND